MTQKHDSLTPLESVSRGFEITSHTPYTALSRVLIRLLVLILVRVIVWDIAATRLLRSYKGQFSLFCNK